jgi:hypothetical protein
MSIEAWVCVAGILLSVVVARDIAIHYSALLIANLALTTGYVYDSTLIALVFGMIALVDSFLGLIYGRTVFLVSAAIAGMVSFEQLLNLDTLLNNLIYADACITAWIIIILAMEWRNWANSKRLSSSP